ARPAAPYDALVAPQRHVRIDARRTESGHEAGRERDADQGERDRGIDGGIAGALFEQQRRDPSPRRERDRRPDDDPRRGEANAVAHDETDEPRRVSAERDAHAELVGAL